LSEGSRDGLRQIGGWFEPIVVRTLKRLAAERDVTHQVLLAEALNDLFEKHGLKRVADEQQRPRGGAASKARRSTLSDG
jgi:hypothetical protein